MSAAASWPGWRHRGWCIDFLEPFQLHNTHICNTCHVRLSACVAGVAVTMAIRASQKDGITSPAPRQAQTASLGETASYTLVWFPHLLSVTFDRNFTQNRPQFYFPRFVVAIGREEQTAIRVRTRVYKDSIHPAVCPVFNLTLFPTQHKTGKNNIPGSWLAITRSARQLNSQQRCTR